MSDDLGSVVLTEEAARDLQHLDPQSRRVVLAQIDAFVKAPERHRSLVRVIRATDDSTDAYRLRAGSSRVLFTVRPQLQRMVVLRIERGSQD